jgi:flagellar assembly protein FliH
LSLTFGRIVPAPQGHPAHSLARRTPPMGRIVERNVAQAAARAKQILADAETDLAERRLRFDDALDALRADARRQAQTEAESSLVEKVAEVAALRQRSLERARDDIVTLARMMAQRIIGESLSLDPERLVTLARRCIEEARGANRIDLFAHPADAARLGPLLKGVDSEIPLEIRPDPELGPGDLRIETDVGTLDARIGTQLANLAVKIRESLRV